MKTIVMAAILSLAASCARAEDAKTFTLTEAQAADYARRLQSEVQQLMQQYQADVATLKALQDQAKPADAADKKDPAK